MKVIIGDVVRDAKRYDAVAHGCNCFCRMGAGIALGIKNAYPQVTAADYATVKGDINKLGNFSTADQNWPDGTKTKFFNLYSQYGHNPKDKPLVYAALELALTKLAAEAKVAGYRVGLPLIGFGLAGGELFKILQIYVNTLDGIDCDIVIWEGEKDPAKLKEEVEGLLPFAKSSSPLNGNAGKTKTVF